jgi:DNA topoisomerase VI subunit A
MPQQDSMTSVSKVQFSCQVTVREFNPIDQEVAWQTVEELKEIRKNAAKVVMALRANTFVEDNETSSHGLTEKIDRDLVRRRKRDALFSVLDEQSYQIEMFEKVDHELIAEIYYETTHLNQILAEYRGKRTAEDVRLLWNSLQTKEEGTSNSSRFMSSSRWGAVPSIKSATCA